MNKIPLVDLKAQYEAHRAEFDAALQGCLDATSFIGGPDHAAFGHAFAAYCGDGAVALCGNGTDALVLAIQECVGPGDGSREIIIPVNTFIATGEAVTLAGYRPRFVDIDPNTHLMDLVAVIGAMTENTAAVIPVHLYGQMVAMDELVAIAMRHGVKVIEDAAQAHGATWRGKGPGHWGDAATYSFYPGKNLGAWGDGGAVFSRDRDLIRRIEARANHGRQTKYLHEFEGSNSRLDGMQAAILRVKLRHLDGWTHARKNIARAYDAKLADAFDIVSLACSSEASHVYHLYVVEVPERDEVLTYLHENGIGASVHYPVPLHMQPAYGHLNLLPDTFPIAKEKAEQVLSLPIYPEMTDEQVDRVASTLRDAVDSRRGVTVMGQGAA